MKKACVLMVSMVVLTLLSVMPGKANPLMDTTVNNISVKSVHFSKQAQTDADFAVFDAILGITQYIGVTLREDNVSLDGNGVAAFYYNLYDENFNLIQQRIFLIKGSDYTAFKEQGNQFAFSFIAGKAGLVFDN